MAFHRHQDHRASVGKIAGWSIALLLGWLVISMLWYVGVNIYRKVRSYFK